MTIGFNIGGVYGVVTPDRNLQAAIKPKVLKAAFGDGYEQRIQDGINSVIRTFNISFSPRAKEEIDDIIAFLDSRKGVLSFDFTYPDSNFSGERTVKVLCEDYNITYINSQFYGCSATLRQVFEP